jgi:hypothetical protein
MAATALNTTALLLSVLALSIAVWKWHIVRDRRPIFSVIRNALSAQAPLWVGIPAGIAYLAVFMILGGRGGRIHFLFGRLLWNTKASEVLAGILISLLVALAAALFVFGARTMGMKQGGKRGIPGIAGSTFAVIAAFCP